MKNLLLVTVLGFIATNLIAQPTIEWQRALGGFDADYGASIQPTMDGGYILAGTTYSVDGDLIDNHGLEDFWVVKLSASGAIEWQKTLGGTYNDEARSVIQTSDGGYIVAGAAGSFDGDVSSTHGDWDYWVVKLNASGELEWEKTFGGTHYDIATCITQAGDGGFVVAGWSNSNDGDVTTSYTGNNCWVLKLSASGVLEWQKSYGGSNEDFAKFISPTSDGGYFLTATTYSHNGDVTSNHGSGDYWAVKLSATGAIQWQKTLGGITEDVATCGQQTKDGGYIITGFVNENGGDVSGVHGGNDFWTVKLTSNGSIEWRKTYGGSGWERAGSIQQTTDGGYITVGWGGSIDGDMLNNYGGSDFWIVKTDESGNIQWQTALGGTEEEWPFAVRQTPDGGFIIAGTIYSSDGDITGFHDGIGPDIWVVKLGPSVGTKDIPDFMKDDRMTIFPNPSNDKVSLETGLEETSLIVSISDLKGAIISTQKIQHGNDLDVSRLPNGIYTLTATSPSGKIFTSKLSKQD